MGREFGGLQCRAPANNEGKQASAHEASHIRAATSRLRQEPPKTSTSAYEREKRGASADGKGFRSYRPDIIAALLVKRKPVDPVVGNQRQDNDKTWIFNIISLCIFNRTFLISLHLVSLVAILHNWVCDNLVYQLPNKSSFKSVRSVKLEGFC